MTTRLDAPVPRRQFLLGIGAGSSLIFASPSQVLAACEADPEAYDVIRLIIRDSVMQGIQDALEGNPETLEASREAIRKVEERLNALIEEQLPDILEEYRSRESWALTNISLEPITNLPDNEPVILGPYNFEYSPVESLPEPETEHCGYVVVSFIGELIGLSAEGIDAFKEVLNDRGLGETLEIIVNSIIEGDFARARSALEYFLEEINTKETFDTLREALSSRNMRRISSWFAGRCVPIIGWALVLWDIVNAFIEYRERFQRCDFS